MYTYNPKKRSFFVYFVVALFAFVIGWQASEFGVIKPLFHDKDIGSKIETGSQEETLAKDTDMGLFWTVWKELLNKYYKEDHLDEQKMIYGAIKGLSSSMDDPYTVFMDPDESKEFNESLEGTLEGIGAELTVKNQALTIVSPIKDSPAEKAGLLPGDIIYKVGDEYTVDMTLFQAITKIRGPKGTTVQLTVIREGNDNPFDISIVRDSINIDSVTMEKLDGGIIYLSVNQFNDKTIEEFSKYVSDLVLNEPKGLIIDLRYNGGGYLDIAVELLSFVLPSDSVAVKIDQRSTEEEEMKTNGNAKLLNVPMVVLVNEGSASASEIFAGAVQDYKRGVVMGTQTFGKGTVQEVESFSDGSSIRMTIANWLTPNGRNVNEVGLTPDIVVEVDEKDAENDIDTQKNAAAKYLMELKK